MTVQMIPSQSPVKLTPLATDPTVTFTDTGDQWFMWQHLLDHERRVLQTPGVAEALPAALRELEDLKRSL